MIFSRLENPTGHFSKHFEQAFETGGPPTFSESIPPISQVPPPPAPSDYIYGKDPRRVGVLFASAAGGRSRPDPPSTRGRIVCLLLGRRAPSGRSNRQQPLCNFRPLSFLALGVVRITTFLTNDYSFLFSPSFVASFNPPYNLQAIVQAPNPRGKTKIRSAAARQ